MFSGISPWLPVFCFLSFADGIIKVSDTNGRTGGQKDRRTDRQTAGEKKLKKKRKENRNRGI